MLILLTACGTADRPQSPGLAAASTTSVASAPATVPAGYPAPANAATAVDAYPAPAPGAGTPLPTIPPSQLGTPAPPATSTPAPTLAPVQVGPLLREVWPQPATATAPTAYLIYSELTTPTDTSQPATTVFWQVDVRNTNKRQKLVDFPNGAFSPLPFFGQVSPDGAWIAYLRGIGEGTALHIVRLEGGDDYLIIEGLGQSGMRCEHQFAWSPDGTRLAFVKDGRQGQEFDDEFYVYDLDTNNPAKSVAQVGWADLIGWYDQTHLLGITSMDYKNPQRFEMIDVKTGKREILAEFPSREAIFCEELSPDRQRVLLSLNSGAYIFDLTTRQFTKLDIAPRQTIWGADSETLLEIPGRSDIPTRLIKSDQTTQIINLMSIPSSNSSSSFSVEGASSDGMYLVICESRQESSKRFTLRTLLYDIANNSWQILTGGGRCANVLGWVPGQ